MKSSNPDRRKEAYTRPVLREYGNLHVITRGSMGGLNDGVGSRRMRNMNMGMNMNMTMNMTMTMGMQKFFGF